MITLNHTIVPANDKVAAAQLFADLFGLEVSKESPGNHSGRFAVVFFDLSHIPGKISDLQQPQ